MSYGKSLQRKGTTTQTWAVVLHNFFQKFNIQKYSTLNPPLPLSESCRNWKPHGSLRRQFLTSSTESQGFAGLWRPEVLNTKEHN